MNPSVPGFQAFYATLRLRFGIEACVLQIAANRVCHADLPCNWGTPLRLAERFGRVRPMPGSMYRRDFTKPDGRRMYLYSRQPITQKIQPTNPPHDPIQGHAHLRWHPLRGEWVAYASHRQNRTFLPPKEYSPLAVTTNPDFPTELPEGDYEVAVFENLFPSLSLEAAEAPELSTPTQPGTGSCEVVVFTQDPDTSLGALPLERIKLILDVWADRTQEIGSKEKITYVLPFENRGIEVGVTLHHPHGQIYSYPFVPPHVEKMLERQNEYFVKNGRTLLSDFSKKEIQSKERIIAEGKSTSSYIPVCARYPYETWIVPNRPVAWIYDLNDEERLDLARVIKTTLLKFDALWNKPFPYLMALFQAPTDGKAHPEAHMHLQIFPPYRTRDRLKYLAGTELAAGMFVNDSLPEEKARELRAVEVKF